MLATESLAQKTNTQTPAVYNLDCLTPTRMDTMQIYCKSCDSQINAQNINIEKAIAKCTNCNAVFSIAEQVDAVDIQNNREPVPMPTSITMKASGLGLPICRRWFSPVFIFLAFFCVLWNGFLVFWYLMAFGGDETPIIVKIFPVGHVAVGVFITYYTIAGFLNTTKLHINQNIMSIKHSPLPWFGNQTLELHNIQQLYCTNHYHTRKNGGGYYTYRLNAILSNGKKKKLLSGLTEPDQALYIEQEVENNLGIASRKIKGEMNT